MANLAEQKKRSKARPRNEKKDNAKKSEDATAEVAESTGDGASAGEASNNKEGAKPKKRVRGNGAALLRKAANKLLVSHYDELLQPVLQDAKAGKTNSTKLLVSLSEGKLPSDVPVKKRRRRGPTQAELLAMEPDWQPPEEIGADSGFGGREPEA